MKQIDVRQIEDPGEEEENKCPLCQRHFTSKDALMEHALSFHLVNQDGLGWFHGVAKSEKRIQTGYDMHIGEITHKQEQSAHPSVEGKGNLSD